MEKIGLLAGVGRLPVECAKAATALGLEVYAVGLLPEVDPELKDVVTDYQAINVAKLGDILAYLKMNGITKVTLLGKVTKELLMSGNHAAPDPMMMQLLGTLPDHKDDTLMKAFVGALAFVGLEAYDQTALLKMLMPQAGTLTKREPSEEEKKDMQFGFETAKELGRLDIGQTVVVKDLAVMALEAIEGTDACIARGGELARGGAVVVKTAKPGQDLRFDVPAVGLKTLETMVKVGAKALAIEAGATLLVDREKVVALAEENDITIVAM